MIEGASKPLKIALYSGLLVAALAAMKPSEAPRDGGMCPDRGCVGGESKCGDPIVLPSGTLQCWTTLKEE